MDSGSHFTSISQPTKIRMTRFIYSLVSLLMLTMGVATFDFWGNRVNIPRTWNMGDDYENMGERSLLPARQTRDPDRSSNSCECNSTYNRLDFGVQTHPRYLMDRPCLHQGCVRNKTCKELYYTFNVTIFSEEDMYVNGRTDTTPVKCFRQERSVAETIRIACVPVIKEYEKRQPYR